MEKTVSQKMMNLVKEYVDKTRALIPEVTDDQLYDSGRIYYANGNDGTRFDWEWNQRVCEFILYYKNKQPYIKYFVRSDVLNGYVYSDKGDCRYKITPVTLNPAEVLEFAEILYQEADWKNKYDVATDEIDFSAPMKARRLA